MEINNMEYAGHGEITDGQGKSGILNLQAPLDFCQLVLSLDQVVSDDGSLLPKITVSEVAFQLKGEHMSVRIDGDLPLYQTQKFEQGVKNWLKSSISDRESDFK